MLVLVLTLGACSSPPNTVPSDEKPAFKAGGTPVPAVSALLDPPRDYRVVQGTGFSIQAPSTFQQQVTKSSNGEPMLVLRRPSSVLALPSSVVVLRDVNPKQDVVEQAYAVEVSKRGLGATDIVRSDLTWPGARRTVLVQWTQQVQTGGGTTVPTRYSQLSAQIDDGLIVVVVALAPAADLKTSAVETVLRTFRPATGAL
jgi:hypothetical protein